MSTESFLATPFATLHIPRCVSIARAVLEEPTRPVNRAEVIRLIRAAEEADFQLVHGPSYTVDEAGYDARVAAVNAAGLALLKAVREEYD